MAALGVPTTRALALLTVDDLPVIRENGPELPSLLARTAPSFIRIGHFEALNPDEMARKFSQIFMGGGWLTEQSDGEGPMKGQGNLESLKELVDWGKKMLGVEGDTLAFFKEVVRRNAAMVGQWQVRGLTSSLGSTECGVALAYEKWTADTRSLASCTACSTRIISAYSVLR